MTELLRQCEDYVTRKKLVQKGNSVLLAVSGGVDSMVLLDLFYRLQSDWDLKLSVIHVNHQLRGEESLGDQRLVETACTQRNIPFYCSSVDVMARMEQTGEGKQAAARTVRYEAIEKIRLQIQADVVATAHHADDNVETFLLNLLRGTGLRGFAGIPVRRTEGRIIRPLLFASREKILEYASHSSVAYRNDSSNSSLEYGRNYLRHKIIPELARMYPHIVPTINFITETASEINTSLEAMLAGVFPVLFSVNKRKEWTLNIAKLTETSEFLQDEILVSILYRLGTEPTEKRVQSLQTLIKQPVGRKVQLGQGMLALRERDEILFSKSPEYRVSSKEVGIASENIFDGQRVLISDTESVPATYTMAPTVEYVDAELLGSRLVLRAWQPGDWFIPLGMKKKKKLSDFFTDQKISHSEKIHIPVLESDGSIVWICGKRLDDRFKITEQTRSAIRLTYQSLL